MNSDLLSQARRGLNVEGAWAHKALVRRDASTAEVARWVVDRRFTETPLVRQCEREQLRREVVKP